MRLEMKCPVLLCTHNTNGICWNTLDDCPFEEEREGISIKGEEING